MTSPPINFHIRDALPSSSTSSSPPSDALFILSAFDSCIPHLATIGSGSQWGNQPFSTARPDSLPRLTSVISDAHNYTTTKSGLPTRALIAEAIIPVSGSGSGSREDEEKKILVGAATLKGGWWPGYVTSQPQFKETIEEVENQSSGEKGEAKWVYLEMLVTSFEEGKKEYRKGAGKALVEYARRWAREEGMGVLFVDCWAGNGGRLVRFYEAQGFEKVGDFVVEKNGSEKWEGMFLRMDLGKGE